MDIIKELDKERITVSMMDEEIIDYQLNMIINNKSKQLLNASMVKVDGVTKVCYTIENKISLNQYLEKNLLTRETLSNMLLQISECFKECKEFLLNYHNLILTTEYIYVNYDGSDINMICVPIKNEFENTKETLTNIVNKLASFIDKEDAYKDDFVKELLLYVNSKQFNIFDIGKLINQNTSKTVEPAYEANEQETREDETEEYEEICEIEGDDREAIEDSIVDKLKTPIGLLIQSVIFIIVLASISFLGMSGRLADEADKLIGGLIIIGAIDYVLLDKIKIKKEIKRINKVCNTQLVQDLDLSEDESDDDKTIIITSIAFLKSLDMDMKEVLINKNKYMIGKNKEAADLYIDNPTISRTHAEILMQDSNYYIKDLQSSNGTYVNDEKIGPSQLRRLEHGDVIKFSNQCFEFVDKA